jgi:uncharacterized membrane protein YgcG
VQEERETAVDSRYVHETVKATKWVLSELEQKTSMIMHYKAGSERKEWLELYLRTYCVGMAQRLESIVSEQSLAQLIPHDLLAIIELATSCDQEVHKIKAQFDQVRAKEEQKEASPSTSPSGSSGGKGETGSGSGSASGSGGARPRATSAWRVELQLPHVSFSELLVDIPGLIERYTEKSELQLREWMETIFEQREEGGSDAVDQDSNGLLFTTAPTDLFQTFNSHLSIGLDNLAPHMAAADAGGGAGAAAAAGAGGAGGAGGGEEKTAATVLLMKSLLQSCFRVLCEYQGKMSRSLITQNDAIYMAATANDCWLMLDNIEDLVDSYSYVRDQHGESEEEEDDDDEGEDEDGGGGKAGEAAGGTQAKEEEEEEEEDAMEVDLQRAQQGFGRCATTAITRLVDIQFDKFWEERAALFRFVDTTKDGGAGGGEAESGTVGRHTHHARAVRELVRTMEAMLGDFSECLNDYSFRKLLAACSHRISVLYLQTLFGTGPSAKGRGHHAHSQAHGGGAGLKLGSVPSELEAAQLHVLQEDHTSFLRCLQQFLPDQQQPGGRVGASRTNTVEQGLKPIMDIFMMFTLPSPALTITSEWVTSLAKQYPGEHLHMLAAGSAVVKMRADADKGEREQVIENMIQGMTEQERAQVFGSSHQRRYSASMAVGGHSHSGHGHSSGGDAMGGGLGYKSVSDIGVFANVFPHVGTSACARMCASESVRLCVC